MSLPTFPSAVRKRLSTNTAPSRLSRRLHASPQRRASILFALSALSNSRETQHFNRITRLSRIEHSPPLKLIKSSEVDPFPCPNPPPPTARSLVQPVASRSALRIWDQKALRVGRVVLADQARRTDRLTRTLARVKRREAKLEVLSRRERAAWHQEREKMRKDMRSAGIWILLSIGTATTLATWRFWPSKEVPRESGDLGRRIAARAAAAMPLPAAVSVEPTLTAPIAVPVPAATSTALPSPPLLSERSLVFHPTRQESNQRWWKNLFWKQQ